MVKIWGRATSVNVQKVMWAVGELGLAHERVDVGGKHGGTDTSAYGAMNPNRLVPVIEDTTSDGRRLTLWESSAIVRYLAATYGRGSLAPSDAHAFAMADQWMDWMQTSLYADIIGQCFGPLVRVTADKRDNAAIAAAAERAGAKLGVLDAQLAGKQFILGDRLTMADIACGCVMYRYFDMPITRPHLPHIEAWYQRLAARKAYQQHVMVDWTPLKIPGA